MITFPFTSIENLSVKSFWVVPDAGSFMLTLEFGALEYGFLFTQWIDLEDFIDGQIPGRIYLNETLIPLNDQIETNILFVLEELIQKQQLGHPQGLAVNTALRIIQFFRSGDAQAVHSLLS